LRAYIDDMKYANSHPTTHQFHNFWVQVLRAWGIVENPKKGMWQESGADETPYKYLGTYVGP